MTFHLLFLYGFAILIALVYLAVAANAWRQRQTPGATALAVLMLAAAEYAVGYILQLASPSLAGALLWYNLSLPGASALGPAWLLFAVRYTRQDKRIPAIWFLVLAIIPLVTCLAAWTNPFHSLYGTNFQFNPADAWPTLHWQFGPLYWLNFGYAYLMLTAGIVLLLRAAARRIAFFTAQTLWLLAGALIPATANLVFVLGYTPIPGLDIAPFTFLITGLCWSMAIFRFRLLDIVPVAREQVLDTMSIGVVVIDRLGRVVDLNPAAAAMIGISAGEAIGQPLAQSAPHFPLGRIDPRATARQEDEVCFDSASGPRYLILNLAPLRNRAASRSGAALLLQDITRRKQAELAEHEQRLLAETLRDTAADFNRAQALPDVLDHILENLGKIVPHQAAQIAVWVAPTRESAPALVYRFATSRMGAVDPVEAGWSDQPYPEALLRVMRQQRAPFRIEDMRILADCPGYPDRDWVCASLGMPIHAHGELIGLALVESDQPDGFTAAHLGHLRAFADQAAIAVENARLFAQLETQALHDDLTGVLNRRGWFKLAADELNRAHRFKHPLGLILFDLDHYKQINDLYGHAAGDQVLSAVAETCRKGVREIDLLGRYGGDEFMIVLPECTLEVTVLVAERLRRMVEALAVPFGLSDLHVTLSAGVAADLNHSLSLDALLLRADQALYVAKTAGRNCVR